MDKLTGIIDEPVSSGGRDHLDITSKHTRGMGPKIFKYYKGKIGG